MVMMIVNVSRISNGLVVNVTDHQGMTDAWFVPTEKDAVQLVQELLQLKEEPKKKDKKNPEPKNGEVW